MRLMPNLSPKEGGHLCASWSTSHQRRKDLYAPHGPNPKKEGTSMRLMALTLREEEGSMRLMALTLRREEGSMRLMALTLREKER